VLDRLAALAVAAPFVLGSATGASPDEADEVFRFQDPAIVESSGLVVQDGRFLTTNDSGDSGRVFAVDPATGETAGVTGWADEPVDVEALAPAGPGAVWVGDIGDNAGSRPSIEVARVPVGPGERDVSAPSYELAYPGGARDAETLLAHPVTGRLYVASKNVFGGALYAAPEQLDPTGVNELSRLGSVLPIATDGAFFPDGRHLVLRDYGRAVVYSFPDLEAVGEVDLPEQQQGEGIAVDAAGVVHVSSEGRRAPVLEVDLPASLRAVVDGEPAPGSDPTRVPGSREGVELPQTADTERPVWPWFVTGWLGLGAIVVLVFALRRR
jgi:hypothetical protein